MGDSVETQERIIQSAIKLFAQKGYHGTKTIEIAKDCGVAEGTVFKYYSTKMELLRNVLSKIIHEIIPGLILQPEGEVQKLVAAHDAEAAKAFLKAKVKRISENFSAFKILINELQYHEDIKNEYFSVLVPGVIKMVEGFYNAGRLQGFFRDINPHIAVRSFIGAVNMMVLDKNVLNRDLDVEAELEVIIDIYLNGVGTQAVQDAGIVKEG